MKKESQEHGLKIKFSIIVIVVFIFFISPRSYAAAVWKVEGGTVPVYLAGSIHLLREKDQIPEVFYQIYQQAGKVAFEVESHRLKEPGAIAVFLKEGRCEAGRQLGDYLSEDVSQLLEVRSKKNAAVIKSVQQMKPWMAAMVLTIYELQKLGAVPERGVDEVFYQKAVKDKKETASLEDVKAHLKLLSSLTIKEQNTFLKYTLLTLDETEASFEQMLASWFEGDTESMEEWFADLITDESEIIEKVLLDRNQKWITPIEGYLKGNQTVMVICGVGHLVGEGSVIDLLEKRGYTIHQLN